MTDSGNRDRGKFLPKFADAVTQPPKHSPPAPASRTLTVIQTLIEAHLLGKLHRAGIGGVGSMIVSDIVRSHYGNTGHFKNNSRPLSTFANAPNFIRPFLQ